MLAKLAFKAAKLCVGIFGTMALVKCLSKSSEDCNQAKEIRENGYVSREEFESFKKSMSEKLDGSTE